jgi:hypothetical protein
VTIGAIRYLEHCVKKSVKGVLSCVGMQSMPVSHGKGREARREERREQRREKEREERREKGREGLRENARNCLRGSDSGDGLFRTSPSFHAWLHSVFSRPHARSPTKFTGYSVAESFD